MDWANLLNGFIGAIVGGGLALVGVGWGFRLQKQAEDKKETQRKAYIRALLSTEIQLNRSRLMDAQRTKQQNLPTQSREIWSSQLSILPGVFLRDELETVHKFYVKLYEIHKRDNDNNKRPLADVTSEITELQKVYDQLPNDLKTTSGGG